MNEEPMNESISEEPINEEPIYESISEPIYEWTNIWMKNQYEWRTNVWINKWSNESINHQSTNESMNQLANRASLCAYWVLVVVVVLVL